MHEHDDDIIMALAEGTFEPDVLAPALAEVSECPECATALADQKVALAAMRSAQAPVLDDLERARLHRTMREALGIEAPVVAEPSRHERSYRRLAALGSVAAVLIGVVVVAPYLNLLGGGGADDSAATTTAAAAEERAAIQRADTLADGENSLGAGGDGFETTSEAGGESPELSSTSAPALAPEFRVLQWRGSPLGSEPDLASLARRIRLQGSGLFAPLDDDSAHLSDATANCLAASSPDPEAATVSLIGTVDVEGTAALIVAYVAGDFEEVTVLAIDETTCRVVAKY
ncbi:MAG TPA: hypothetical protein VGC11_04980 [Acidimicrobiia bacterium]|jgi:hypothetical protein